ncbi:hypothetical protein EZV62_001328 [Acer yangbiense]|uniref:NAC domain-containing protein n=1 Tax=Acer yangbiense TaxID=1000413 RepID=A0A5C7IUK4_9ROSI|nr:hypothetical protein EZV62_001328 [Acer yangbiense]
MRVGYRFQPTPKELVNYFLKEKRRDLAFTDPDINDVNIYKQHPCELPERKLDKKHEASSDLDEGQLSDSCDSRNNVAQDIPEAESQLQPNQHISYVSRNNFPGLESHLLPKQHISSNGEDLVAKNISSENQSQLLPKPKDIFLENLLFLESGMHSMGCSRQFPVALVMTLGICNGLSEKNSSVKKLNTLFLLMLTHHKQQSHKLIRDWE